MNIPSWLKWPPNCCETCVSWQRSETDKWIGKCNNDVLGLGEQVDARYRCPQFKRKDNL
jgi:hypothetical protein